MPEEEPGLTDLQVRAVVSRVGPLWGVLCAILLSVLGPLSLAAGHANEGADLLPDSRSFSDQPVVSGMEGASDDAAAATPTAGPGIVRIIFSLGGVIVLIVALGWVYKRMFAQQHRSGAGVILVARTLLTPKHQVFVLRAGRRLLIIGDSGHGMNLLCQVDDPSEIDEILGVAAGEMRERAEQEYGQLPGADADAFEQLPGPGVAQTEVRSLIERVRGLAGSMQRPETAQSGSTE